MRTLNGLTQSRLAAFLIDSSTRSPVSRLPVYGELAVYQPDIPRVTIDGLTQDDIVDEHDLAPLIESAIETQIGDARWQNLSEDERRDVAERMVQAIRDHLQEFFDWPRSRQQAWLDDVARSIAEGIPPPQELSAVLQTRIPLGFLATDHAGFLSFDLEPAGRRLRAMGNRTQISAHLYPLGLDALRVDVLEQGRITPEFVLAKLEMNLPQHQLDLPGVRLAALQNPGLLDWYLSPASFSAHPDALVGQDGCEHLFPGNFSLHEYMLRQVVRLRDAPAQPAVPAQYKMGYVDEYRVSFQPVGHSLGQILYSLPLAPGETVKLAVIDWSYRSDVARTESTLLYEDLLHETHRDRTITETVKAGLREFQTGSSFMGGAAASLGATGTFDNISAAGGLTGSLGGSTATSEGSRDLAAQNVQRLVDSFSQASSSRRELQSTVVIQARQEQKQSIQTRTFSNYNHSHTLTILYYEVLRHYRLVTEWVRRRPVLLRRFSTQDPTFPVNDDNLLDRELLIHRPTLEPILLDSRARPGFDTLEKLATARAAYERLGLAPPVAPIKFPRPVCEGDFDFCLFRFVVKTAPEMVTEDKVVLWAVMRDGGRFELEYVFFGPHANETHQGFANSPQNINSGGRFAFETGEQHLFVRPKNAPDGTAALIRWRNLAGFQFEKWGDEDWRIIRLGIQGFDLHWAIIDLLPDTDIYHELVGKEPSSQVITFIRRPAPDQPEPPPELPLLHRLTAEEYLAAQRLRSHVTANAAYYLRAIALAKPEANYAIEFEDEAWTGAQKLIDHAVPTPLEVSGRYMAFPFVDEDAIQPDVLAQIRDDIRSEDPARQQRALDKLAALSDADLDRTLTRMALAGARAEKLISLPTRGVFAEGKLGHCTISEEIDNNRFWKWEEHPIPIQAPEIAPVTPITPTPQAVTIQPTAFPAPLVNIVSPTAAPDPAGLTEALKALATPNIFRDMSGRVEVADLLKKLSDNSIDITEAANKAREIRDKHGENLDKAQKDYDLGLARNSAEIEKARLDLEKEKFRQVKPADAHDSLKISESETRKGNKTPEEHKEFSKTVQSNLPGAKPPTPAPAGKPKKLEFHMKGWGDNHIVSQWRIDLAQRGTAVGYVIETHTNPTGVVIVGVSNEFNDTRYAASIVGEVLAGFGINAKLNVQNLMLEFPADKYKASDYLYVTLKATTDKFHTKASSSTEATKKFAEHYGVSADVAVKKIITISGEGGWTWERGENRTAASEIEMDVIYYTGGFTVESYA